MILEEITLINTVTQVSDADENIHLIPTYLCLPLFLPCVRALEAAAGALPGGLVL